MEAHEFAGLFFVVVGLFPGALKVVPFDFVDELIEIEGFAGTEVAV